MRNSYQETDLTESFKNLITESGLWQTMIERGRLSTQLALIQNFQFVMNSEILYPFLLHLYWVVNQFRFIKFCQMFREYLGT